jgi:hypothetical protein
MSVSCADGNGSYGTYHVYQWIPNRIPPKQCSALVKGRVRPGIKQRLWVYNPHAPEEILRVIWVDHVLADAHPGALAVLVFVDKVLERVAEPGFVAETEGVFPG